VNSVLFAVVVELNVVSVFGLDAEIAAAALLAVCSAGRAASRIHIIAIRTLDTL